MVIEAVLRMLSKAVGNMLAEVRSRGFIRQIGAFSLQSTVQTSHVGSVLYSGSGGHKLGFVRERDIPG